MKKIFTIIMTAALFVALAIPTFAASYPSTLPAPPEGFTDYIVFKTSDNKTHLFTLNDIGPSMSNFPNVFTFTHQPNGPNSYLRGSSSDDARGGGGYPYKVYYLSNGSWIESTSATLLSSGPFSFPNVDSFVFSTFNIYDYNDKSVVLFPLPPSIHQILTEEVPTLVVDPMMKTLSILVPFGVGLMALLICLPILKKLFYQFQVR